MEDNVILGLLLVVLLYMLYRCSYLKKQERFGVDNKPFEPDNIMLNRNPYDDIDYIVPTFLTKF